MNRGFESRLAALCACGLLLAFGTRGASAQEVELALGQPFPEFWGNSTENKVVRLSDFRGKYVLIDFWATWCGPCLAELPNVHRAYELYNKRGLEVLSVSIDRDYGQLAAFQATHRLRLKWPCIHDKAGQLAGALGVDSIPRTFLIDPDGVLVAYNLQGRTMLARFEQQFNPSGMADILDEWKAAPADRKAEVEAKLQEVVSRDARSANGFVWTYLSMNGKNEPEVAGVLRRTLEKSCRASGLPEYVLLGLLDTVALAAYLAGDAAGAATLQDEVIELAHRVHHPRSPQDLVTDSSYAEMVARLGLYHAKAGDVEKARALGQFLWPHHGDDSALKQSWYFKELVAASSGTS
jgi:peroxiredoxin